MITRKNWVGLLMLLSACGGGAADDDDDQDGGVPSCDMVFTVNPGGPEIGDTVDLDGSISKELISGIESYQFTVTRSGSLIDLEERDPFDGSRMSFVPTEAGPYHVVLSGAVDSGGGGIYDCVDSSVDVNVIDPAANTASFRFRFLPTPDQPAPAQERTFEVYGGAAFELGPIGLDNGVAIDGTVEAMGGAPVPGYLRITPSGVTAAPIETFAGAGGAYEARVAAGNHDVLLVPDDGLLAPAGLSDLTTGDLTALILPDGDAISGVVQDAAGDPLPGAQVSLRIGGVPSTTDTTDGSGAFTVLAHPGGVTTVSVVPPAASGLPRLELPASEGLVAATSTPLTIRYAASWTSRTVALEVRQSNGTTPAPGATVLWLANANAAGTVTPGAGAPLDATGAVRVSAIADGSGQISGLELPELAYVAVVLPAGGATGQFPRLVGVNLASGQTTPATLSLAQAATVTGTVTGGGAPLSGVEVRATPLYSLANLPQASASATTDAAGGYSLALVGGGQYELTIVPRVRTSALARLTTIAPAAGGSASAGTTDLVPAIKVGGRVTVAGLANPGGIAVEVYCTTCTGTDAALPVAEAVTDPTGRFVVAVPDPGIDAQ